MICYRRFNRAFTIVELLIVVVVIGIIAAVTLLAYNGTQLRAQEAKRAQDFNNIVKALQSYDTMHGGVPVTWSYGGNGNGGWNNSTLTNWLTFLESSFGKMPRDPVNVINSTDGLPDEAGERTYYYYCYPSSSLVEPNKPTVAVGYRSGATDQHVRKNFIVQSCLLNVP